LVSVLPDPAEIIQQAMRDVAQTSTAPVVEMDPWRGAAAQPLPSLRGRYQVGVTQPQGDDGGGVDWGRILSAVGQGLAGLASSSSSSSGGAATASVDASGFTDRSAFVDPQTLMDVGGASGSTSPSTFIEPQTLTDVGGASPAAPVGATAAPAAPPPLQLTTERQWIWSKPPEGGPPAPEPTPTAPTVRLDATPDVTPAAPLGAASVGLPELRVPPMPQRSVTSFLAPAVLGFAAGFDPRLSGLAAQGLAGWQRGQEAEQQRAAGAQALSVISQLTDVAAQDPQRALTALNQAIQSGQISPLAADAVLKATQPWREAALRQAAEARERARFALGIESGRLGAGTGETAALTREGVAEAAQRAALVSPAAAEFYRQMLPHMPEGSTVHVIDGIPWIEQRTPTGLVMKPVPDARKIIHDTSSGTVLAVSPEGQVTEYQITGAGLPGLKDAADRDLWGYVFDQHRLTREQVIEMLRSQDPAIRFTAQAAVADAMNAMRRLRETAQAGPETAATATAAVPGARDYPTVLSRLAGVPTASPAPDSAALGSASPAGQTSRDVAGTVAEAFQRRQVERQRAGAVAAEEVREQFAQRKPIQAWEPGALLVNTETGRPEPPPATMGALQDLLARGTYRIVGPGSPAAKALSAAATAEELATFYETIGDRMAQGGLGRVQNWLADKAQRLAGKPGPQWVADAASAFKLVVARTFQQSAQNLSDKDVKAIEKLMIDAGDSQEMVRTKAQLLRTFADIARRAEFLSSSDARASMEAFARSLPWHPEAAPREVILPDGRRLRRVP
jgi:hypothetical protein